MAEVTNELMYEVPKNIQFQATSVELWLVGRSNGLEALSANQASMQVDMDNDSVRSHIDSRLDRIENRLELRELAEPKRPFDHTP